MTIPNKIPWWWKLFALGLLAGGIALLFAPGAIGATELWARLLFVVGAALLAGLGMAVLKSKPPSARVHCPDCGSESRRSRLIYYCAECGHALNPDEDELEPYEINCPFCQEPIAKGIAMCPHCANSLPNFGVACVKGQLVCLWCKTRVEPGQKFCGWCSAPLEEVKTTSFSGEKVAARFRNLGGRE